MQLLLLVRAADPATASPPLPSLLASFSCPLVPTSSIGVYAVMHAAPM